MNEDCIFDFGVDILDKTEYLAGDLALYKAEETDPSAFYFVFIIFMVTPTQGHIIANRIINAYCHNWQIFHLDYDVLNKYVVNGYNPFSLRVVVNKNGHKDLRCSEISSLFLLNASFPENKSEEMTTSPTAKGSGDYSSGSDDLKPEPVFTEAIQNPFSLPDDELINYIPVLNLFKTGRRKKREASIENLRGSNSKMLIYSEKDKVLNDQGSCQRIDKIIRLNPSNLNATYTIIKPQNYNVGECAFMRRGLKRMHSKCIPTNYRPLEMLILQDNKISVHKNDNIIVIDDCGLSV